MSAPWYICSKQSRQALDSLPKRVLDGEILCQGKDCTKNDFFVDVHLFMSRSIYKHGPPVAHICIKLNVHGPTFFLVSHLDLLFLALLLRFSQGRRADLVTARSALFCIYIRFLN